jgi:hypothetical protein
MSIHAKPFTGAGQTFALDAKGIEGAQILIEDYWDRVAGGSWMFAEGNPVAMAYAIRSGLVSTGLPIDDEVVYGKVNGIGHIVHVSELGKVRS